VGLEAASALGQPGYAVSLAETKDKLGGRVHVESQLLGLSEWGRVVEFRSGQINQMSNIETFLNSDLTGGNSGRFSSGSRGDCHWRALDLRWYRTQKPAWDHDRRRRPGLNAR
jgi:hypothetical protein